MSLKGGTVCAVRGCSSRTASKNIILFRFPRDPSKGKAWLEACNRLDLTVKSPLQLYNNYKICALHFEARMFSSPEQNRLLPMALPTIFPGNEIFGWEDKLSEPIIILSGRRL